MKNALIWGGVIGVLSAAWLFITHALGYDTYDDKTAPFEYISVFIPIIGLFLGILSYRNDQGGKMGFLEALIQSFKILLFGGVLAVFVGIVYINIIQPQDGNFLAFSGRMFGALLVGLLAALGVSLVLATRSNKID
jgi:ABC-type Fe3+ transport system permease subunit